MGLEDGEPGEQTMTLVGGALTLTGTLTQDLKFDILTSLNSLIIQKSPQSLDLRMACSKIKWKCQNFFGTLSTKAFPVGLIFSITSDRHTFCPSSVACYVSWAAVQVVTAASTNTRRSHTCSITWKREIGSSIMFASWTWKKEISTPASWPDCTHEVSSLLCQSRTSSICLKTCNDLTNKKIDTSNITLFFLKDFSHCPSSYPSPSGPYIKIIIVLV